MQAFVTGSTGLLGSNLVHTLVDQGWEVKALVRSREKGERFLDHPRVRLVEGDMQQVVVFVGALSEDDVLFHAAAYFREYALPGDHHEMLRRINVDGTIALLREAAARGVRNVVYVSSSGVLDLRPGGVRDETAPYNEVIDNAYFRSKIAAEKAISRFLESHDIRVVLALPGAMMGPGDIGVSQTGQYVINFLNGCVGAILPGGLAITDARDAARAMVRMVEIGARGERFIIQGPYFDMATIVATLARVSGVPAPRRRLSVPAAFAMATGMEVFGRLTGRPALINRRALQRLRRSVIGSSAKAERALGTTFRPLEETLRDEVEWFRANGYT
ncbi:MAG: NAD-dependent epimerase/dehydratase family protein [Dehalococcoidia bacterium]